MSKEHEAKRAAAAGQLESYIATIDSIEPNIHSIGTAAFYASAAISLKRIADVADLFALSLLKDYKEKDDGIQAWAHRHGFGDLWDKATGL